MIRLVVYRRDLRQEQELYVSQFHTMDEAVEAYRNWLRSTGFADKEVRCEYQEV